MYKMRRSDKLMSNEASLALLDSAVYGTLGVYNGETPYCVPVNYVHAGGNIYIHGARSGLKLDAIAYCDRVCFNIVGNTKVLKQDFDMEYESVTVFGTASILEDPVDKAAALRLLALKYSPEMEEAIGAYIAKDIDHTRIIKVAISHITGKHSTVHS